MTTSLPEIVFILFGRGGEKVFSNFHVFIITLQMLAVSDCAKGTNTTMLGIVKPIYKPVNERSKVS